jgi:hypothetical protein
MSASQVSARGRPEDRSGDAVKIWNHIQGHEREEDHLHTSRIAIARE